MTDDRPTRLAATHAANKAALEEIIRLSAPTGDRIADGILRGLGDRARRMLATISRIEKTPFLTASGYDDLGEWGEHGRAPAIRSDLHSARYFRRQASERRAA
jgi:hypothetical protein